jgi:CheY-like chemotaxis protein
MSPKHRVLVVDDDLQVSRTLKLGLDATGRYEVRVENRGTRAVAAALEFGAQIVLLDVVMPDTSGHEVLRQLRAEPCLQAVPVVFLTAAPPECDADTAQPDEWISKPALASEVAALIDRRLATGRAR